MVQVNNEEASILTGISTVASIVGRMVNDGLETVQLAEKVAAVLDPAIKPDLDILIDVLQEAQKLIGKVDGK